MNVFDVRESSQQQNYFTAMNCSTGYKFNTFSYLISCFDPPESTRSLTSYSNANEYLFQEQFGHFNGRSSVYKMLFLTKY